MVYVIIGQIPKGKYHNILHRISFVTQCSALNLLYKELNSFVYMVDGN